MIFKFLTSIKLLTVKLVSLVTLAALQVKGHYRKIKFETEYQPSTSPVPTCNLGNSYKPSSCHSPPRLKGPCQGSPISRITGLSPRDPYCGSQNLLLGDLFIYGLVLVFWLVFLFGGLFIFGFFFLFKVVFILGLSSLFTMS